MASLPLSSIRMLVPIDGSALGDQAIAHAVSIARQGDQVIVLHVAPALAPPQTHRGLDLPMTDQDIEKRRQAANEVTRKAAGDWRGILPSLVEKVEFGNPAERIIQASEDLGVDFIVMATHARGTLGRLRHGSVADEVLHKASVPVVAVRSYDVEGSAGIGAIERIILPLDGTDLAAHAILFAEGLARRLERPIHLIRVSPGALTPGATFGEVSADSVAREAAVAAERNAALALEDAAKRLENAGTEVTWDVEIGDPVKRICEFARSGDIIVLASHGRSGLDRALHGSVAEKLIRHAKAPVAIVPNR